MIHDHLVNNFANTDDLESAVHRQMTGTTGYLKYDNTYLNAASLMFGVCNNHPFFNGNKRTALVSGLMHLDANDLVLENVTKEDLYRLMLRIAKHETSKESRRRAKKGEHSIADEEIEGIADWLHDYARPIRVGERNITFGELYRILTRFGYRLGDKKNNKVEILKSKRTLLGGQKWVCAYKAPCPGDGQIVRLNEIKTVREALQLTESNGVDSESFYNTHVIIDSFIRTHRNVLRKLAKT